MSVSSDIKFTGQNQKQHRNGKACRASKTCFWLSLCFGSSLIYLISKETISIYHASLQDFHAPRVSDK